MSTLFQRLPEIWKNRSPRERWILIVAAMTIVAVAWLRLLWLSEEKRQVLTQQIQGLEYRIALSRMLASRIGNAPEAGRAAPAAGSNSVPPPSFPGLTVKDTGGRYLIAGMVPFDAWVVWLSELQRIHHIVVTSVRIRKGASPGLVEVEGELQRVP